MFRYCRPPTINELMESDRDVITEVLPETVVYKSLVDGAVQETDYKQRLIDEIKVKWGDSFICYMNPDRWVRAVKPHFSPEKMDRYGLITGLYSEYEDLDRTFTEYEMTTEASAEGTESREDEDLPDTPVDDEKYLSGRGKVDTSGTSEDRVHFIQKSGPPRLSRSVYEDMEDAFNPIEELVEGMRRFFMPMDLLPEWMI